jgi:hypothetical protein
MTQSLTGEGRVRVNSLLPREGILKVEPDILIDKSKGIDKMLT